MAEAAKAIYEENQGQEHYARSLRTIRAMGNLAVNQLLGTAEYSGIWNEAYADFNRAVGENLATDKQFGERLSFDPLHEYTYVGGHVVDKAGKPIIDMVRTGKRAALQAAESDSRMLVQAERDEGDEIIAHIVDNLEVNEMYMVVSVEPKDELKNDPEFWHEKMHYLEGMAVVQVYYRVNENEMQSGYYSLKGSNAEVLRKLFAEQGVDIPAHESPNRYSRYGIRKSVSNEQAEVAGPQLVERHRRETGQTVSMLSVTELVGSQHVVVRQYFDTYIPELASALQTNSNNKTMQSLAGAMLMRAHTMGQDDRTALMRVANSKTFQADDARFMEGVVRYALIEELRKPLEALLEGNNSIESTSTQRVTEYGKQPSVYLYPNALQLSVLNEQLSRNVATGRGAGRTYGGCSGVGSTKDVSNEINDIPGSQKIWSGMMEDADATEESDKFGPLKFQCRKGHTNTRPRNSLIDKCRSCHENVRCAPDDADKERNSSHKSSKNVLVFGRKQGREKVIA